MQNWSCSTLLLKIFNDVISQICFKQSTEDEGSGLNKTGHELVIAETVGCVYKDSFYHSINMCLKFSIIKKTVSVIPFWPEDDVNTPWLQKALYNWVPDSPANFNSSPQALNIALKTLIALLLSTSTLSPPSPAKSNSIFRTRFRCPFLQDASTDYSGLGELLHPKHSPNNSHFFISALYTLCLNDLLIGWWKRGMGLSFTAVSPNP